MSEIWKHRLALVLLYASSVTTSAWAGEMFALHCDEFAGGDTELPPLLSRGNIQEGSSSDILLVHAHLPIDGEGETIVPAMEIVPAPASMPSPADWHPELARQDVVQAISSRRPVSQKRDYHLLPDGLMWHSYLAGPQEPRISAILLADDKDNYYWDATLGGRVGFLRYGTAGAKDPKGWQWDLEGAVITRLNLLEQEDVESMDYRFGTQMTWAEGPWAMKFGYYHISSHVGDEYMLRNPTFERINYVTESLVWGISHKPLDPLRVYGESVFAIKHSGGAKRWQFQTGAEWTATPIRPKGLAPFAAANLGFRESTDYHMATTLQAGWYYQGPESDRRLRFGAQYGKGPTSQFEFFTRSEEYIGWGIWFDY